MRYLVVRVLLALVVVDIVVLVSQLQSLAKLRRVQFPAVFPVVAVLLVGTPLPPVVAKFYLKAVVLQLVAALVY